MPFYQRSGLSVEKGAKLLLCFYVQSGGMKKKIKNTVLLHTRIAIRLPVVVRVDIVVAFLVVKVHPRNRIVAFLVVKVHLWGLSGTSWGLLGALLARMATDPPTRQRTAPDT